MIYTLPLPEPIDQKVLEIIWDQQKILQNNMLGQPRRWTGSLRRSAMARAIRGSNSIEGYHATMDQAVAAIQNEPPPEYTDTWLATKGYRDALTYILQASSDPHFEFSKQFLKSLHFMIIGHEMANSPGKWRTGSIFVVNQQTAETVYEGPPPEAVNGLIEELVESLKTTEIVWAPLQGAMAHLNLTMIHPFKDGNGRMARALQSLVIARAGMTDPILCSIEEWLGENTQDYYKVLTEIGQGKWSPQNNSLPWIRFCLKAHYQQAQRLIRRHQEYSEIYEKVHKLILDYKLNDRCEMPLFDACIGLTITNTRYRTDSGITEYVASRDLKKISELGLLDPMGDGRGRVYSAGSALKEIRQKTRSNRKVDDPYVLAEAQIKKLAIRASTSQLVLPLEPPPLFAPES
jgi:Fic family protein